jgi:hypothetical protein
MRSASKWRFLRCLLQCSLFLGFLLPPARSRAQATVSPNVTSPVDGALVGDNLSVVVNPTSTYQVQSVIATVGDRTTNLSYTRNVGWTGTLSLVGVSRGAQTLIAQAVDVYGNSGQSQVSFVHDSPPALTVLEPSSSPSSYNISATASFTRPTMRVRASATDDDPSGGAVIRVYKGDGGLYGSTLLATATNSLDTIVDLSNWDGSFIPLTFVATDSAGQTTTIPKGAYVIANTNIIELDRVSGSILDFSESNILFTTSFNDLKTKSRSTGVETLLVSDPGLDISSVNGAALTPHGAIFVSGSELYELRDESLIDLGPYQENFVVKGNYAIWISPAVASTELILRDLIAGTNVVVSFRAGNTQNDVAPNGDVVYWGGNDYQIYRFRGGITTLLGAGIYPRTDGVNVGYFEGTNLTFTQMALFDDTNKIILGQREDTDTLALNNGWTAFMKQGNPAYQVWTRSPAGDLSQRTFFGTSSFLVGLAPNGDLMVQQTPELFFTSAGSALDLGKWKFGPWHFCREGHWYATLGASLLTFQIPSSISISQPGWTTNGDFSFHGSASIGQQVMVQESTDLMNWVSVSTNYVSGTSGFQATIRASGGSDKKFYRLILAQ